MFRGFFWALLLMPIIEIALLIQVGSAIGVIWTLLLILLTAALGTALLRAQGLSVLLRSQQTLGAGQLPAAEIAEGFALAVGGALLLTPGFVTDAFGFCLLIPSTRRWLLSAIGRRARFSVQGSGANGPSARPAGSARGRASDEAIEGEFRREE